MSVPLTKESVTEALAHLPGWKHNNNALEKSFVMRDFSEALGFIVRVGVEAERINHHPELNNVWSRVTFRLSTHDAGDQITALDVQLAEAIEKVAKV
ncbi:MAG: 4a-hydroxytetrahydrobiopterin dehydratase [Opitutaceae bacterium]